MESQYSNDLELALDSANSALQDFCDRVEFVKISSDNSVFKRLWLIASSFFTAEPYFTNWLTSKNFENSIRKLLTERKYDAVYFGTIGLCKYRYLFDHEITLLDHHNIESHMMMRRSKKESNILKKIYFYQEGEKLRRTEIKHCSEFSLNLFCSTLDRDRLLEFTEVQDTLVTPNGVDTDFFKPVGAPTIPKSMIFAGGLTWYPNVDAVLFILKKIWPLLTATELDCKLTICGRGINSEIEKIASTFDNVEMTGFVNDIRPFIESANLYLCPITDGGGTKLKILDAMSMGKVVISDPIAAEGIDVTNNLNIIFARNEEEFVEKIIWLLKNREVCQKIGDSARQLMRDVYDYQKIGIAFNKKISEVVSDNGYHQ
jgi:glycosyltransferase involved in cell wall biosynthesis